MAIPQKVEGYTFADYAAWDESERMELIDGKPVMQAVPSILHQWVVGGIYNQLSQYLAGKGCKAFVAPLAVQLFADSDTPDDKVKTVVEPDIMVICDPEKLRKGNCVTGAPDLIVEVLSPSTQRHDRLTKFNLYWSAGVREYWIVSLAEKSVQVFLLKDGEYRQADVGFEGDRLKVNILEDCEIDLAAVFAE